MTYDLIVRNGTIVDGLGGEPYLGDVAVRDGVIKAVGAINGDTAAREIDATGLLVTPGFVDLHTHYDGQSIWSERLSPSSAHGVTTVVMGNCGIGFAPCRPDDRERLIDLMEGVEDIPEAVMAAGLPWTWETFPQYLDVVDQTPHEIDVAALVPHSALRVYVMGQRGVDRETASSADIAEMVRLTRQAVCAGALGIATSRTLIHRTPDGSLIPSHDAAEDELHALAGALSAEGDGVFQAVIDINEQSADESFGLLKRIAQ